MRVAIDDFGTGYASLSNLQRMPVDVLKVDRSFVAALNDGGQSRELLEAILGVGQALSLAVVAEGIEVQSQMVMLEEMGCEMAQGFLMGRPTHRRGDRGRSSPGPSGASQVGHLRRLIGPPVGGGAAALGRVRGG